MFRAFSLCLFPSPRMFRPVDEAFWHSKIRRDADHLIYAPVSYFISIDTFAYTANDGQDDSNASVATITVAAPGANNSSGNIGSGGGCLSNTLK